MSNRKRKDVIYKTKKISRDDLLAYVEWSEGILDSKKIKPAHHGCEICYVLSGNVTHIFDTGENVRAYPLLINLNKLHLLNVTITKNL